MEKTAPIRTSRRNPYVGPRSFETGEALYGRGAETRELVSLLCAERIALLHSPSGAGKTSLIQAALIPCMVDRKFYVRPVARVNREPARRFQAENTNRYIFSLLSAFEGAFLEADQIPDNVLAGLSLADYLARRPKPPEVSFELFIFDQFEEIITLNPADREQKYAFFTQIGRLLANDTCFALFSMREDYLGALDPYLKYIPDRFAATFRLDLLGVKAAAQALQRPAEGEGVAFEDAAAQQLLNDLRQVQVQRPDGRMELQLGPYIEPVQLQVVAFRLWEGRKAHDCSIGMDDLAALGDVGLALGAYYAQQVRSVARQTGVSERAIREWFDRRLISEGSIRSQVRMGAEASEGLANTAVRLLENAHLIRAEKRGGSIWYELSHDRLIEPVHKDNLTWFAQHLVLLQRQAAVWEEQRRPEGLLLRDKELVQAEAWAERHSLLPIEKDFLDACRKAKEAWEQAQKQAEKERMQSRRMRVLAIVASIAALIAVAGVFFALFAMNNSNIIAKSEMEQRAAAEAASILAEEQRDQARISQLAAQALAYQDRELDLALLFSVEAYNRAKEYNQQDDYQIRNSLLGTLERSANVSAILRGKNGTINSVAFSPDGKIIAAGNDDTTIQLWDAGTRQPLGEPLKGHKGIVTVLAFTKDDNILASYDGIEIRQWDVVKRQPIRNPIESEIGASMAFSPDGKTLAAGDWVNSNIYLWDAETGAVRGAPIPVIDYESLGVQDPWDPIGTLAFSQDGKILAVSSANDTIQLWDMDNNGWRGEVLIGVSSSSLAFSPDGRYLVSGSYGSTVHLWDMENLKPEGEVLKGHTSTVNSVAFSSDGKLLASASGNTILVWDVESRKQEGKALTGHNDVVNSVAFQPKSRLLASGSSDATILLWDLNTSHQLGEPLNGPDEVVAGLAFSKDGLLAIGGSQKTILWDLAAHKLKDELPQIHSSLAFSPQDGEILAIGNETLRLYHVEKRELQAPPQSQEVADPQYEFINSIAFSMDGQTIATGTLDTIRLWNGTALVPGEPILIPEDPGPRRSSGASVAFSPDGRTLAACGWDGSIHIWDVANLNGSEKEVKGNSGLLSSIAFSPDGSLLASGGDKAIILWDAVNDKMVERPLRGHTGQVNKLVFSPDGKLLASGSADSTIILWDVATKQPLGRPLLGNTSNVLSLAFSADSKILASGSYNKNALLWDVDPVSWVERACRIANRNLSEEEWKQFIGEDEPYLETCPQHP